MKELKLITSNPAECEKKIRNIDVHLLCEMLRMFDGINLAFEVIDPNNLTPEQRHYWGVFANLIGLTRQCLDLLDIKTTT